MSDVNAAELKSLYEEFKQKQLLIANQNNTYERLGRELTEIEDQLNMDKQAKLKIDQEVAAFKDEEALLNVELNENLTSNEAEQEQKLNDSLLNFSVTGTEEDSDHNGRIIIELCKKLSELDADVRTLQNDGLMCKQQIDEINANINEIAEEHAKFLNENNALESEIAQLNVEKQTLTAQQDDLREQLAAQEMNQVKATKTDERGNSGIAQFDNYVKQIRMKLVEGREQKRQTELQHMEIAQRLDAKRRRREMAEKSRVTDATVLLMQEVYTQLSFVNHLKLCIDAFYANHSSWIELTIRQYESGGITSLPLIKSSILERIRKFRNLLEMARDSICAVLSKVPVAYQAELQQFNEVKQRFQQKLNSTIAGRDHSANRLNDLFKPLYDCLSNQ